MSFRPNTALPPKQDMPPPGGFPGLDLARKARTRGPSGLTLWVVSSAAIMWGFSRVGAYNKQAAEEKYRQREARYALAPILQAEEDRLYMAREAKINEQEAEIMKNRKDWKVGESVYLTDRWVPRHVAPLDKNSKK